MVESARTTELSRIIRLRLTYEPAAGDAPSSLILKTARPASVGAWIAAEATERDLQTLAERLERFIDFVGDRLSRERRALFELLLQAAPRLLARYHTHRNVTIVQGDAHVWNSFLPRDGGDDVRLFDWDLWRIDVASDDLAYMMAMYWYPDLRRRRMERSLLDRYHAALVAGGVHGDDRRALDDDYRLSVLWHITTSASCSPSTTSAATICSSDERMVVRDHSTR